METLTQQHETSVSADTASILRDGGFIEPHQLANELGISERTLARWAVARMGPPKVKLGKQVLYRRASVIEWLQSREESHVRTSGRGARR